MRSTDHAGIGAVVGWVAIGVLARGRSLRTKLALWVYGVLLSVFVDLDHFVLARLKTGDWSHLRRAATHPTWALTSTKEVFPDVSMKLERLTSHVIVGGILVLALRPVDRLFATYTAIVLYAHLLADLLHDIELVR